MNAPRKVSFPPCPLTAAYAALHNVFVETRRHAEAVDALKRLFCGSSISGTHKGLALIGPSGSGKTTTVCYFERWLRLQLGLAADAPSPLPMVLVTTNTTGKALSKNVLVAAGDPMADVGTQHDAELRMLQSTSDMPCVGFALDEFHHAFSHKGAADAGRMAMTLKTMVNSLQKPIVVMGTDGLEDRLDASPELKMRFQRKVFFEDPRVTSTEDLVDLRKVMQGLKAVVPLATECDIDSGNMLVRLLVAANGQFGSVVDMVRRACEFGAYQAASQLMLIHFCAAYRESAPRKLRTDADNPFLQSLATVETRAQQLELPRVPGVSKK